MEEIRSHSRPDEGDGTFGDHGSVKNRAAELLVLKTACHEGALGGMETADGAAGYGYEQAREDGLSLQQPRSFSQVPETVPKLRDGGPFDEQAHRKGYRHENERKSEDRIEPPYYLVYRQEGGYQVIDKHHGDPYHHGISSCHVPEYDCRAVHENGSDQYHQHD